MQINTAIKHSLDQHRAHSFFMINNSSYASINTLVKTSGLKILLM